MNKKDSYLENIYRIKLKGCVDQSLKRWFGDISIMPSENGETNLVGHFADQPALRGLVDQLWNLNLTVLLVEKIEDINLLQNKI